ncbi:hypothetical protein EMCRGX_G009074 [Ephydatia muelleri]
MVRDGSFAGHRYLTSRYGWRDSLGWHPSSHRNTRQKLQKCQSSIIRAARNFDGTSWVAYDRQFRREAMARKDLNWSVTNARLYSEAFTGRARALPRCRYCLSETHELRACPVNPDNLDPTTRRQPSPTLSAKDVCRNYNEGRCRHALTLQIKNHHQMAAYLTPGRGVVKTSGTLK